MKRSYSGPALDATYQHISERPAAVGRDGETVYAIPEPEGQERTENVPMPEPEPDGPASDRAGQTTISDWGGWRGVTCPACERENVALIGGLCGHCKTTVASAITDALEDVEFASEVVDVFKHRDGYYHLRLKEGEDA
ncbi:hypothetical protein [Halorarum salinum]|uniref:Uncharacterized protein n=1 Tax=Halorarum salinum TaxID=2743089 RepID=A0A7D5QD88_9EURY|nr:hypothetical protein [Halobaculum salinum]QLG63100.1 hypothetical protein HUG12_15720 [Halobaculum salinum]